MGNPANPRLGDHGSPPLFSSSCFFYVLHATSTFVLYFPLGSFGFASFNLGCFSIVGLCGFMKVGTNDQR